jgi:hypothetical protein
LALLLACHDAPAAGVPLDRLNANNVVCDTPGADSRDSMPLGNGDIGLNVWTEKAGDVVFYLSKTDAWSDNVGGNKGLLKLGRVRVKLSPGLLAAGGDFSQTLKLADGEIMIHSGASDSAAQVRVWADANRPVIRVESETARPSGIEVTFETLRPAPEEDLQADTILTNQANRVVWFYRNQNKRIPQLTHLTFGAAMRGNGLISASSTVLHSVKPAMRHVILICALTAQTDTPEQW